MCGRIRMMLMGASFPADGIGVAGWASGRARSYWFYPNVMLIELSILMY